MHKRPRQRAAPLPAQPAARHRSAALADPSAPDPLHAAAGLSPPRRNPGRAARPGARAPEQVAAFREAHALRQAGLGPPARGMDLGTISVALSGSSGGSDTSNVSAAMPLACAASPARARPSPLAVMCAPPSNRARAAGVCPKSAQIAGPDLVSVSLLCALVPWQSAPHFCIFCVDSCECISHFGLEHGNMLRVNGYGCEGSVLHGSHFGLEHGHMLRVNGHGCEGSVLHGAGCPGRCWASSTAGTVHSCGGPRSDRPASWDAACR